SELLKATVYWDPDHKAVNLKEGVMELGGDAYGYYNDSLLESGWGVLELRAGYGESPKSDSVNSFLSGYLEGYLTAPQMFSHYTNMYPNVIKDPKVLPLVQKFISEQDSWARGQVKQLQSDPLWRQAGLLLAQMDGLQAGAAHCGKKYKKEVQSQSMSGYGVPFVPKVFVCQFDGCRSRYPGQPAMGHCSALIKVLPGFENLLMSHSSWYTYAATLRIYKHWDLRLTDPSIATGKLSFSSYPGSLVSMDDFYLLGSGLVMLQTTNSIFNRTLYQLVTPQSLLAWQRVRLAHALARDGQQWAEVFARYNSGTYNNQYMVVDLNRVFLGSRLEDGALIIVEQIPGLVEHSDQTQTLRRGYWPSYNVPFHERVYNASGYPAAQQRWGDQFSYELCARAKILRRDQGSVNDLPTLKHAMRYNDYKHDPYSEGNPCLSICCRNDLQSERPSPGGCYDTKVTDFFMAQRFVSEAINGPTMEGGLPPFSWDKFNRTVHQGLPRVYNFSFVSMQPVLFKP
ncbi:PLBL1 Phospholipase, partial [Amia calva]|nr:PLBL1 Phospholipase [Amia calva]